MTTPIRPVSTLVELGQLIRTRPGLTAPVTEVAAWYERKAVVLHHIAVEAGDADTERCSRRAHDHAVALLVQNNILVGGVLGQGKAAGMRAVLLAGEVTGR